ncbi:MAG: NAD(P)-dependent oxidoreductase [Nitrospirae bacterium]|nr:MAG: NAD(P)-dependent oxidoreductase [Nitrospirota bacterium]
MNALVTGNSGLIGKVLVARLGAIPGVRVRLFRTPEALRDIRDRQAVREALKGMNAVFHLASLLNYRRATVDAMRAVNVEGTRHLLDEALAAGISNVIVASSQAVYAASEGCPGPFNEETSLRTKDAYSDSKREADELCQKYLGGQLCMSILRLATIYGSEFSRLEDVVARFVDEARGNGVIRLFGKGQRIRDLVFVEDAVEAMLKLQGTAGVFNIGGGRPYMTREIAETVREAVGGRIEYDGPQEEETGFYLDISKARAAIGYEPVGFGTGLQRSLAVHA